MAYNCLVQKPAMPNASGKPAETRSNLNLERRRILRAEAAGIFLIALAVLIFTIVRFGAHINWSAR
jgi:hypothetical protein